MQTSSQRAPERQEAKTDQILNGSCLLEALLEARFVEDFRWQPPRPNLTSFLAKVRTQCRIYQKTRCISPVHRKKSIEHPGLNPFLRENSMGLNQTAEQAQSKGWGVIDFARCACSALLKTFGYMCFVSPIAGMPRQGPLSANPGARNFKFDRVF